MGQKARRRKQAEGRQWLTYLFGVVFGCLLCWCVVSFWFPAPALWTPGLGYPGEGPTLLAKPIRVSVSPETSWTPQLLQFDSHFEIEREWVAKARSKLAWGFQGKDLNWGSLSDEEVHETLLAKCHALNQPTPVAARLQSRPDRLSSLLGEDSGTTAAARGGVAYSFASRPQQPRRPRSIRLPRDSRVAVDQEVHRLRNFCGAVETAPEHDGDKALLPSAAKWERTPLRPGPWPRERPMTMLPSGDVPEYDRQELKRMRIRRSQGMPFRDFESPVFTVPKSDGGMRLCTDYRELNRFQRNESFKMEGVQSVSELLQRGDYGMLVDLKDAYLTLGLHPYHRNICGTDLNIE